MSIMSTMSFLILCQTSTTECLVWKVGLVYMYLYFYACLMPGPVHTVQLRISCSILAICCYWSTVVVFKYQTEEFKTIKWHVWKRKVNFFVYLRNSCLFAGETQLTAIILILHLLEHRVTKFQGQPWKWLCYHAKNMMMLSMLTILIHVIEWNALKQSIER